VATVRKIWADTKLIYDATASNTQATEKYPGVIRIYTGDETQEPNSTIEMHEGSGNVRAYRGLCYLVFTDLQLADFANRIPNISAEIVASGAMACEAVILPKVPGMYLDGGIIDPTRGILIGTTSTTIFKYDLINNQLLLNVPLGEGGIYGPLYGFDNEGYIYHSTECYAVSMHLVKRHPETLAIVAKTKERLAYSISGTVFGDKIFVNRFRKVYSTDLTLIQDLSEVFPFHLNEASMCADGDGNMWQIAPDYIRKATINNLGETEVQAWDVSAWTGGNPPEAFFWDDTTGHLYFKVDILRRIVKWNVSSGFVASLDGVALGAGSSLQGDRAYPQNGRLWAVNGTSVTLVDLAAMRIEKSLDLSSFKPTLATHATGCYEKFTHSAIVMTNDGEVKYPLERYGSEQVSLSSVLSSICRKAGLSQTDILVNEVNQSVRGYVVTRRTSAREALEPLLNTFFIDAVETDGALRFIPRGQAVTATILYDDLGAVEGTSNESTVRLTETRAQELEQPLRIDLTHYDPARDYQTNTQHAARNSNAVVTKDLQTVEVSIVLSADEAAQVAEKKLTDAWIGRTTTNFNLPPKWLRLDPGDVIDVNLQDATLKLRLTQVDLGANNIVACQAIVEDDISYESKATGVSAVVASSAISIATPISALVMDLPMLRAEDNGLGLYYAFAFKENTSATLYRSQDDLSWSIVGNGTQAPAFGWAADALANVLSPWVWDETNTVQIALSHGLLDSKTALEVLNWNNVALLGDEIIQWREVTLLSANLYKLSGLLRGRRGTEWATSTHKVGERFVVLATDGFYRTAMASTQISQTSYYKAVTSNGDWDDAREASLSYSAASLRCFSPVHIKGTRDASGNLTFSWVRRARWNGDWINGIDIPLYEEKESYEIDILNGSVVVRTLSSITASVNYTAAQQVKDFGAVQSSLAIAVYQLNATIGRGYAGKATV